MLKSLQTFFSHPQSIIVGFGFMSLSLLMSTWSTRLPELKSGLGMSDSQIGLALLISSFGSLIISPFSSYIMDRFPTGLSAGISVLIQSITFILPFFADSILLFYVAMFIVGLALGFINITLNASAAIVEKSYKRSIMSSCHAMFSMGAIIGAVGAGFIKSAGISPETHITYLVLFLLVSNVILMRTWKSIPDTDLKAPILAFPTRPILKFFLITLCLVLAELTIMDWSAVYLSDTLQSPAALTGLGFAGFSLTMAIGRLSGDTIVPKIGEKRIIFLGSVIACLGLGIAAFTMNTYIAILGFVICGLGMSITVPLIYSMSARLKGVNPGVGIASIATACVLGGFIGRPLAGFVSDAAGMSMSMWIATGFIVIAALIAFNVWKNNVSSE